MHSMSETVIVAALRKGNLRRAVELILDSYQDEVFGYCARLVEPGGSDLNPGETLLRHASEGWWTAAFHAQQAASLP